MVTELQNLNHKRINDPLVVKQIQFTLAKVVRTEMAKVTIRIVPNPIDNFVSTIGGGFGLMEILWEKCPSHPFLIVSLAAFTWFWLTTVMTITAPLIAFSATLERFTNNLE